jgi:Sec-independent protein translocase protein TatA
MFGLGMGEIILIAIIAIVLFGTDDLPKNLRKVAKGVNDIKKVAGDAQRSWNEVKDDVTRTIMTADIQQDLRNAGAKKENSQLTYHDEHSIPLHDHLETAPAAELVAELNAVEPVVAAPEGRVARTEDIASNDNNHGAHTERSAEPEEAAAQPAKSSGHVS